MPVVTDRLVPINGDVGPGTRHYQSEYPPKNHRVYLPRDRNARRIILKSKSNHHHNPHEYIKNWGHCRDSRSRVKLDLSTQ